MRTLALFLLTLSLGVPLFAAGKTWKGVKRSPQAQMMVFEARVDRFYKEDSNFKLVFSKHAAIYIFPIEKGREAELEKYLVELQTTKRKIKVTVDPYSREISELTE